MWHVYTLGLAMGLYAAALPGPINLEVVRRAISRGPRLGLAFGLGAALADVAFVLLSSLGALALINALPLWGKGIMWLTGSVILFVLGINGLRVKVPGGKTTQTNGASDATGAFVLMPKASVAETIKSFVVGLALTLSSPPTIMFWVFNSIMVASSSLTGGMDANELVPYFLAAGVGTACTLWVTGAVFVTSRFHRNLRPQTYVWVERIAGSALCLFACYALFEAVKIVISMKAPGVNA